MELALRWAEIAALIAFALSGYLEAERRGMDPIGHFVLAFVAAFGGGTLRDLLIDRRPLFWIEHQGWVMTIFALSLVMPWLTRNSGRAWVARLVPWPDALGLGLFAATGTVLARDAGLPDFLAVMMGVITATFGGVIVDVLSNTVPRIFKRTELQATCAFVGGWCLIGLDALGASHSVAVAGGALIAFVLRMLAVTHGWRLPVLNGLPGEPRP